MLAPAPSALAPSSAEPSLALPRSFWKDFTRQTWNRKPTAFRGLFPSSFPTTQEIFEALQEAGARYLRGEYPGGRILRFFVEHEDGPNGLPYYSTPFLLTKDHLPGPEDRSAEDFVERLTRNLGGKRFGIVLDRAQCHHWGHWLQMRTFLSGFHEAVGVPLGKSDSGIFFGNYLYTPFGIHKDDLHIFYFVVHGKKTLSLWPFEALSQRDELPKVPDLIDRDAIIRVRDRAEEQQLLAKASFLEGTAGDLLYWPASYWHRAEPSKGLAISASLGVSFRAPEFAGRMPPMEGPVKLRHTELPGKGSWQVPAAVRDSLRQQGHRQRLIAAEREQKAEWLRLLTAGALDGAAPEALGQPPLAPQDAIRATPERPIVSVPLSKEQVMVAANGHSSSLTVPAEVRGRIARLVKTLNTGKPQQVETLEEAFFSKLKSRGFNRRAFRALLDDLVRWRAVARCEPR